MSGSDRPLNQKTLHKVCSSPEPMQWPVMEFCSDAAQPGFECFYNARVIEVDCFHKPGVSESLPYTVTLPPHIIITFHCRRASPMNISFAAYWALAALTVLTTQFGPDARGTREGMMVDLFGWSVGSVQTPRTLYPSHTTGKT